MLNFLAYEYSLAAALFVEKTIPLHCHINFRISLFLSTKSHAKGCVCVCVCVCVWTGGAEDQTQASHIKVMLSFDRNFIKFRDHQRRIDIFPWILSVQD
jgi:hypothetical protein